MCNLLFLNFATWSWVVHLRQFGFFSYFSFFFGSIRLDSMSEFDVEVDEKYTTDPELEWIWATNQPSVLLNKIKGIPRFGRFLTHMMRIPR